MSLAKVIDQKPIPFHFDEVKDQLIEQDAEINDSVVTRYQCLGTVARHVGKFGQKFTVI